MPASQPWLKWDGEDLLLTIHVQPRASRDEIGGPHGDRLKIRITAPPVDGKANTHLLTFIARAFGVAVADVELIAGQTGREKRLRIHRPRKLPEAVAGAGDL